MFRWLVESSLQFRFVVLAAAVALIVFGSFQIGRMPVDVFPEFDAPMVEIQTEALGLSAQEMEDLVTSTLEELLSGVPWLKSIRSESVTGLSSIVLTFDRGTDIVRARQMVQERLVLAVHLPNVAKPPSMIQPLSATSRFMIAAISSDEVEETELSMIARWAIKPKLTGIPGVANVSIWGQRLRQMQIHIDPRRLRDTRITQHDIITAAGDSVWVSPLTFLKGSTPGTGGWIDNPNQRLGILHTMPIKTPEDMARVPVAPQHLLTKGQRMALGDVAEVTFDHPQLIGDAFVNGRNGLMLVIEKFPSANTLEVTAAVEQALREMRRGLPGVEIDTNVFRLATYIEDSIDNLTQVLVIGAILVVFLLGAFLSNWRKALVSLVAIPLSLIAAVVVCGWMGATLNTMVLAGLVVALGVVIDDAIVGIERFTDRLRISRESGEDTSILQVLLASTLETRTATVYAVLIILLAAMPIFLMGESSGAFFRPLASAYALAVVASLVVGLTVTPALSLTLFGGRTRGVRNSPVAVALRTGYEAMLRRVVGAPWKSSAVAGIAVVLALALWPLLGQSLLPSFKEQDMVVSLMTAPGTSHQETYRITKRLSKELKSLPGVRSVGAHVGRAITGDQIVGINSAQVWLGIDPDADYEHLTASVRQMVDGYPGIDRNVQTYLRNIVSEALSGVANAVVVRIFGHSRDVLERKAEEVRQALSDVEGLVDLRTVGQLEEPHIKVQVDLGRAGAASVTPGEVRRSAATVFAGLNVGFLFEEQKIFDVVVWGTPEIRRTLQDIEDVLVEKSDRHHVRLGDVADVKVESTPTVIRHDRVAPYVDVVANVAGRDLAAVNTDVEARLETVDFPLEFYPQILGEFAEHQSVQQRTLGLAIAAVIGIFLLLQACFRSWRLGAIGFLTLPAAIAGGVVAAFITDGAMTLGSIVGLFAVLGIAARNVILLISHYRRLEREERVPFDLDLVLRGARDLMSPMLASSTAIVAALLPIVFFGPIAGLEIIYTTAVVITGGVIASTLVTLFIVPTLYLAVGASRDRSTEIGLADS